jgi:hypothetical protein
VKTDASARQSEMNRAMPHELNTKCADETFPYVETRNAWQFSNSGRTSEGDFAEDTDLSDLRERLMSPELCGRLGDGIDQAAW